MQDAARILGVTLAVPALVRGRDDFEPIIVAIEARRRSADSSSPTTGLAVLHRDLTVDLTIKHRLPAIYAQREHADAGGAHDLRAQLHRALPARGRLCRQDSTGREAGWLPVEQPTSFELVLNMKTAKAVGLTFSAGPASARGPRDRRLSPV